jgi:hypothetical protein
LPSFVAHNAIRAVWEKMLESFASANMGDLADRIEHVLHTRK